MEKKDDILKDIHQKISFIADTYTFPKVFLRGIVSGLGTAIGATLVFAIVIFILSRILASIGTIPLISDIFEQTGIQQLIDRELSNNP